MMSTPYRYAVYFSHAKDSLWWQAGSHWLGRCAASGRAMAQPDVPLLSSERMAHLTAEPRRYGWHATLKAPFELAQGHTVSSLLAGMSRLAREFQPFTMPAMRVRTMGDFLALRPANEAAAIKDIASSCVTRLHPFARSLSDSELARRRRALLTQEEDLLLKNWGYPWVLGAYRFHFTLSGSLSQVDAHEQHALREAAERHFHALPDARFDRMSLFAEPSKGADFVLIQEVELGE
ncbi:MAG: hypothetical protein RL657_738 [Pseudomonadota bacterium]